MNDKKSHTEVLVIGGGPTGLTMACELLRHGITPRIIDKAPAASDKSKAFAIHARTLELFDNIGIVDNFLKLGSICTELNMYDRVEKLINIVLDNIESKYPFVLLLPQSDSEKILYDHLKSFGTDVERGLELIEINQTEDRVIATIGHKDGTIEKLHCSYLVGCDGAHSTTRHQLNLDFKGAPYPNYWLLADIDLDWEYPMFNLSIFIHPTGVTAYFPFRSDRGRLMFELPNLPVENEMDPPILDDVHKLMNQRGIKFNNISNPYWLSYFKLHHRIVDKYGEGRVFLCGDAAHIHSPLGGQGMNTGIQDSYNLAWKMALVLKGKSHETLLDSYNIERHRIGEEVVGLTDRLTKMATAHNPVLSLIRNKMMKVISKITPVQEKIISTLAQLEFHYKDSPLVDENWEDSILKGQDLKPGERVKDYVLEGIDNNDDTKLFQLLLGFEHELLLFTGIKPHNINIEEVLTIVNAVNIYGSLIQIHLIIGSEEVPKELSHLESVWIDKKHEMYNDFGVTKSSLYLIRPDGYVAFRNQPASVSDLMNYLATIFK